MSPYKKVLPCSKKVFPILIKSFRNRGKRGRKKRGKGNISRTRESTSIRPDPKGVRSFFCFLFSTNPYGTRVLTFHGGIGTGRNHTGKRKEPEKKEGVDDYIQEFQGKTS